jgi:hypothetical protein
LSLVLLQQLIHLVNNMKKILSVVALISLLTACSDGHDYRNSQQIERDNQEKILKNMAQSVGMPAIVNFSEKRMMKDILELRDQMVPTYTYLVSKDNTLKKLCDSVGYGLPYATQYTNPSLADPNGLYAPASADGTWVQCINPQTKKVQPVYIEPRVVVSPFALQ